MGKYLVQKNNNKGQVLALSQAMGERTQLL
jgi:hypothetical protein